MAANPTALPYRQYTPHSITDRDYWAKVKASPQLKQLHEHLAAKIDKIPALPVQPLASEFLAARRRNDRGVVDKYWQSTRAVLTDLVLNRCIDGDTAGGVDDKLLDWLFAFLTQPSWVVSAHLPKHDLPLTSAPQLDLAACEMAANLAETLQMIRPWINNQSQTLEASIIYEIDRRVLQPFVAKVNDWWYDTDPKRHWNNWAGVCAGSILAACESLAAIGQPRPEARAKALEVLNIFLDRAFTPAGECDEGIGYWGYGVGFACLGWSRLSEAEFRKVVNVKRLKTVADYPEQVHLFDHYFFSGNDAPLTAAPPLIASVYLAGAVQSPWLMEWSRSANKTKWEVRNPCLGGRIIDALLAIGDEPAHFPAPPVSRFVTDQQVGIFQNGKLTVCFTGGTNAEAHNHNDLGHFVVLAGKQVIVPDLGAPAYTTDFFGPQRYTYLSASSRGHCCPIINNQEQIPGRAAAGKVLECDLENQVLSIDMTSAYPPEAHLARWIRKVQRTGKDYLFTDEFCTTTGVPIENVIWSTVEPKVDDAVVTLGSVTLTLDPKTTVSVEPVNPKDHKLRDFKDTLYRLGLKYETKNTDPIRVTWKIIAGE